LLLANFDQADLDLDGLGNPCDADADGDGHVTAGAGGDDCDDSDAGVSPETPERCNGVDDDCDGPTDAADASLQAVPCEVQAGVCEGATKPGSLCVGGAWQVCTDATYAGRSSAYQARLETRCDGLDNDCHGSTDEDFSVMGADGGLYLGVGTPCGVGVCSGGHTVCADYGAGVSCSTDDRIGAETCNGLDDDCDGLTDANDGADLLAADETPCENQSGVCSGSSKPVSLCRFGSWGSCVDAVYLGHAGTYEAGVEVHCDGLDNDCSGTTDEDFSYRQLNGDTVMGLGAACGVGRCAGGTTSCTTDQLGITCASELLADVETCNAIDDDCDGSSDAADATDLLANDSQPCSKQSGVCAGASKPTSLCVSGAWQACGDAQYRARDAAYEAGDEVTCDGRDNDCDGGTDEDFTLTQRNGQAVAGVGKPCGVGLCAGGTTVCNGAGTGTICPSEANATGEACNGVDDDCDGQTDEGAGTSTYYRDGDDDGYGNPAVATVACSAPSGYVSNAADCNDGNGAIRPGASEACNGVDDNCSGSADETFSCVLGSWYSQGCGNCGSQIVTCNSSCQWSTGACTGQGECSPGTSYGQGCGFCGWQTVFCNGGCQWEGGACGGQGECWPGWTTPCATSCGTTGTRSWSGSCSWDSCTPPAETCFNNVDDDCDGQTDEGCCGSQTITWNIPAGTVGGPSCITTGGGTCTGVANCSGPSWCSTDLPSCGQSHCGTLRCNGGSFTRAQYCSTYGTCSGSTIVPTGFGW
jgi:hypothetical protein